MKKEKVICLPSSDLGYLSRLIQADVEKLRQSLRTGDYFDRRSQERLFKYAMDLYERLGNCEREIPAINPEDLRPKGKWEYYSTTMQECSVCKRHTPRHRYEFCPRCGAKMEE